MIPGPVELEQDVREVMGAPVQPHSGADFAKAYHETTEMLKSIFGTQGDVFLLVGSGSAGVEACVGSVAVSGEKIIVGSNGFFGDRLLSMAESYGLDVINIRSDWGEPLRPEDFRLALAHHPDARAVAIVHLETSTTVVNPIAEVGIIARSYGVPFLVDAVSSIGGMPVRMDDWGIDLCASASQKCLGGPTGLAPVAVGPLGWAAVDRVKHKEHGWYLDLRVWRQYARDWSDWHPFPITMATSSVLALRQSLCHLLAEGAEARFERYRALALRLRAGLRQIGIRPFTPDEIMAPVITAAYSPPGIPSSHLVQYLADIHEIRIAGALGETLKDKIFRIGHMSPTVTELDIDRVVGGLAAFLTSYETA
jgi:alanine-glyoxylate transaminase/serine-glyoxylate transaminase/serine-pyruvate transaminase